MVPAVRRKNRACEMAVGMWEKWHLPGGAPIEYYLTTEIKLRMKMAFQATVLAEIENFTRIILYQQDVTLSMHEKVEGFHESP